MAVIDNTLLTLTLGAGLPRSSLLIWLKRGLTEAAAVKRFSCHDPRSSLGCLFGTNQGASVIGSKIHFEGLQVSSKMRPFLSRRESCILG